MRVNDVPQGNETSISLCPVSFTQVPFPSSRPAYFLIHVSHPCMLQNLKKISFLEFLFKSSSTTVPYVGIFFFLISFLRALVLPLKSNPIVCTWPLAHTPPEYLLPASIHLNTLSICCGCPLQH